MESTTCKNCSQEFHITDEDRSFYEKIITPPPTLCPQCREQRRMLFRNELHLYKRKCDLCMKDFISMHHDKVPFPVYCYNCWWSDKWDALEYRQEYDSSRPFFQQIKELFNEVPHLGVAVGHNENCEYGNYTNYSKNSYLVFGCHEVEDSMYDWRTHWSLQCLDCVQVEKSKYCYECIDCDDCYELSFSQDCGNCSSSAFLYDCRGCQNCLFSAGLRNKEYHIFNKKVSKEEFESEKEKLTLNSRKELEESKKKFAEFIREYPHRNLFIQNSENSIGDHIFDSKNVRYGFNVRNVHDGAYLESCEKLKDAMDCCFTGWPAELVYEGISAGCIHSYNAKFCSTSWTVTNVEYCESCHHSQDLFGCIGLRRKNKYCILNKQYEKEEYEKLRGEIVEKMKTEGEYGEFFPAELSPFAYNESVANNYYPQGKEEAVEKGFKWKEPNPKEYRKQDYRVPDDINDAEDAVIKEMLSCGECSRNYKIIKQELSFYRKFNLPIPTKCFYCRHNARMAKRNPRTINEMNCSECGKEIKSTHTDRNDVRVLCEECYKGKIY